MERLRTRRPSLRPRPAEAPPTYELLKPDTEWSQDDSNRILLVHLPGFKQEDIKVQLESSGKLIVRGNRKVTESKFVSVDHSVDVPKDVVAEKIVGRFENGRLTLTMPIDKQKRDERKAEHMQPKPIDGEEEKDEPMRKKDEQEAEPTQPKMVDGKEKKDEPTEQERDKDAKLESSEKKDEPLEPESEMPKAVVHKGDEGSKRVDDDEKKEDSVTVERFERDKQKVTESPKSTSVRKWEEWKPEHTQTKPIDGKEEKAEHTQPKPIDGKEEKGEPMPKKDEQKAEPTQPKMVDGKEKKDDPAKQERDEDAKLESGEKKEEPDSEMPKAVVHKGDEGSNRVDDDEKKEDSVQTKTTGSRKRRAIWRDGGNLLERMKRNRKVIAVAVVAFSAGFCISHQLKSGCAR